MHIDVTGDISLDRLARALCADNLSLLATIRECKPESLTALAKISGRAISNLSRTIRTLERLGLVETVAGNSGTKVPRALWQGDKLTLVFKLDQK